jgi:hypothetical protein
MEEHSPELSFFNRPHLLRGLLTPRKKGGELTFRVRLFFLWEEVIAVLFANNPKKGGV